MKIGNREFDFARHTYVMGILNVTPDSFSDGGRYNSLDQALFHAEQMLCDGVDLIDVGGESTRPGHQQISEEEEISRIAPVIEALKKRFEVPISIDTYRAAPAREAIKSGADLVNDIWGLKYDKTLAKVIAESGVACCLMHNRDRAVYENFFPDMLQDLEESLRLAEEAGIPKDGIILDPGVGFGKSYEMNLQVLHHLDYFRKLGYPLLLGCSRKSVIGLSLDLPVDEREEGTLVTSVLAVQNAYAFVRVHDVLKNKRAIRMMETIRDGGECENGQD